MALFGDTGSSSRSDTSNCIMKWKKHLKEAYNLKFLKHFWQQNIFCKWYLTSSFKIGNMIIFQSNGFISIP